MSKTPCEKKGYKVGDRFVVLEAGPLEEAFSGGSIIELQEDDRTCAPLFKLISGECVYNNAEGRAKGAYYPLKLIKPIPSEAKTMKVQEGDYVDVRGMDEHGRGEVVRALMDAGVAVGEGFHYCNDSNARQIGVRNGGVWFSFIDDLLAGRKLTLSDLSATEWNGEGLPPVGCEVEYRFVSTNAAGDTVHSGRCKVLGYDDLYVWIKPTHEQRQTRPTNKVVFTPIRTKKASARDELLERVEEAYMDGASGHCGGIVAIVDALIAAGYTMART